MTWGACKTVGSGICIAQAAPRTIIRSKQSKRTDGKEGNVGHVSLSGAAGTFAAGDAAEFLKVGEREKIENIREQRKPYLEPK